MSKRGLGKGLGALFDSTPIKQNDSVQPEADLENAFISINIDKITPNKFQPRQIFDEDALRELAESIKENGVIQPIIVREQKNGSENNSESGYELVAGERRWLASKIAGLETVPAIVQQYTDLQMLEIALIENLQRQDLNAIEEALTFRRLMEEFHLTQEEIARKIGRSRPVISNSVRLLNLNKQIQDFILKGVLTAGQAKPLLAIEDENLQLDLVAKVINEDYSARNVEDLVRNVLKELQNQKDTPEEATEKNVADAIDSIKFEENFFVSEYEDRLKLLLGAKVKIKPGKLKSKIEIEFYSNEDLERIMEAFTPASDKPEDFVPKFNERFIV